MTHTLNKKQLFELHSKNDCSEWRENIGCITNKIKTFEDALAIVGCSESIKFILGYTGDDKDMLAQVALAKLTIIIRALNEGWIPNWLDVREAKWFVWSHFGSLGWSSDTDASYFAYSAVGSRLMLRNKKLAEYVGTQFAPLYNDLFSL